MGVISQLVLSAVAVGIGATLLTDAWNLFLRYAFSIPSLSYCLLGRLLLYMPEGRFSHESIAAAPQKRLECAVGWAAHYLIGVVLALAFVALVRGDWLARPTLFPALLYGIGTVVFPLFILQPAFGFGIAASRTPKPAQARLKSLVTHIIFGVGLYLCAVVLSPFLATA
jgi:Protein of unknown function (DUF2938)